MRRPGQRSCMQGEAYRESVIPRQQFPPRERCQEALASARCRWNVHCTCFHTRVTVAASCADAADTSASGQALMLQRALRSPFHLFPGLLSPFRSLAPNAAHSWDSLQLRSTLKCPASYPQTHTHTHTHVHNFHAVLSPLEHRTASERQGKHQLLARRHEGDKSKMIPLMEKYGVDKMLSTGLGAVQAVWGWTRERMWPIYSAAVVISLFQMIAVSSEKQIMADHYFGDVDGSFAAKKEELVADAKRLFNEEVTVAVKEHVWQLPPAAFRREYNSRLGSS
ncbi:hypothetical protein ABL78_3963 [Leptomonas seymouri]|uniref:Uncharacterized protein n=1 Tax=Leptomonas seymouri TaxID=5684 RepID=A0A0N1I743_LEPSE|nr:hypothetical protein ABL78_3963 [Leptomonas seymouri]|eukprot:KPI86972.1 hypothetical protein ABL78_3963 [Leptomonas seymouri]